MIDPEMDKITEKLIAWFENRVAKSWYAKQPFSFRLIAETVSTIFGVYIVAWISSSYPVLGLSSPNTWSLSTWAYVSGISFVACLAIRLRFEKRFQQIVRRNKL